MAYRLCLPRVRAQRDASPATSLWAGDGPRACRDVVTWGHPWVFVVGFGLTWFLGHGAVWFWQRYVLGELPELPCLLHVLKKKDNKYQLSVCLAQICFFLLMPVGTTQAWSAARSGCAPVPHPAVTDPRQGDNAVSLGWEGLGAVRGSFTPTHPH